MYVYSAIETTFVSEHFGIMCYLNFKLYIWCLCFWREIARVKTKTLSFRTYTGNLIIVILFFSKTTLSLYMVYNYPGFIIGMYLCVYYRVVIKKKVLE